MSIECVFCRTPPDEIRWKGSSLRIEPMGATPRCALRNPNPCTDPFASKYLASGGDIYALGHCTPWQCPRMPDSGVSYEVKESFGVMRNGEFVELHVEL
jgi:hypothetical protein